MAVVHVLSVAALLPLLAVIHFNTNLRYTFDRSTVKIHRRILFLAPILQLVSHFTTDFPNFAESFFRESSRAKQLPRSMRRTASCKKATELPELPVWASSLTGQKSIFSPISETEFEHLWNWLGKN